MRRAVVVGCSAYKDGRIGPLQFAHSDAEKVANALEKYCGVEDIALCTSSQTGVRSAERSSIVSALLDVSSKPSDVVFFFFSGHGFRSVKDNFDYLLPQDAINADLEYNSLRLVDVISFLERCKARCTVLIIDACRNFTRGGKSLDVEALQPIDPKELIVKGTAAFFSCQPSERSYEAIELNCGIFTGALLDGLSDVGRCRTVSELDDFLSRRVPELSRQQGRPAQTPLSRVEPFDMARVTLVSNERLVGLNSDLRLRTEVAPTLAVSTSPNAKLVASTLAALDLGSSNSLCAFPTIDHELCFLQTAQGRRHIPSAIYVLPDMTYRVGQPAIDSAAASGGILLRDFKRILSTGAMRTVHGRDLPATDLLTVLTASILRGAGEMLGAPVSGVLAAVPASFGFRARDEYAQSIERAGALVARLISEPCAAAICAFNEAASCRDFAREGETSQVVLVIDVGGGTTDVAVVTTVDVDGEGQIEVESISGDSGAGGVDFDVALQALIKERLRPKADAAGLRWDHGVERQVVDESERAKIRLGVVEEADVVLMNLESPTGLHSLSTTISRGDLAASTEYLTERIEDCIQSCVVQVVSYLADGSRAHGWDAIDTIMLAGMGCKIWPVRQLVQRLAGKRQIISRYEENAVAAGLAHYAWVISSSSDLRTDARPAKPVLLLNALQSSISIDCEAFMKVPEDGESDPSAPDVVVNSQAARNRTSAMLVKASTLFPHLFGMNVRLAGPDSLHTLVVHEKDSEGRVIELARIPVEAIEEDRTIRLTVDIDAEATVFLRIEGASRKGRNILLCGKNTRAGRYALESGRAEALAPAELPPNVPRISGWQVVPEGHRIR